jgi:hypothetical protein
MQWWTRVEFSRDKKDGNERQPETKLMRLMEAMAWHKRGEPACPAHEFLAMIPRLAERVFRMNVRVLIRTKEPFGLLQHLNNF